ncbi:ABC transporter permease [Nonomuraea sp. NN258]|uniref:ABC transporter permease n=1 Tax=Nonomuraea antri TaxID=2730852 RepID=UPI0015699F48|nr:ABC transporter permease [Nonomuraea antri]NRQ39148.1 ABC transporter permease [Nonomuraea antri]
MSSLILVHTRYQLLEQFRVPIGVLASSLFPAVAMLAFVVPFVGKDTQAATLATGSLMFFGAMSSALFSLSIGVAQDRELPWNPYLRTLPAGPLPRLGGRILATLIMMLVSVVPVLVVGAIFTEATISPARLLLGLGALIVGGLPFMLLGLFMGLTLAFKAAVGVTQLVFFPLAVVGGLLLPPQVMPDFIEVISIFTPARDAAELLWAAIAGHRPEPVALIMLAVWTVVTAAAAGWAYRRDEGRRFS